MNFSLPGSETWESDPFQDKFIQEYFKNPVGIVSSKEKKGRKKKRKHSFSEPIDNQVNSDITTYDGASGKVSSMLFEEKNNQKQRKRKKQKGSKTFDNCSDVNNLQTLPTKQIDKETFNTLGGKKNKRKKNLVTVTENQQLSNTGDSCSNSMSNNESFKSSPKGKATCFESPSESSSKHKRLDMSTSNKSKRKHSSDKYVPNSSIDNFTSDKRKGQCGNDNTSADAKNISINIENSNFPVSKMDSHSIVISNSSVCRKVKKPNKRNKYRNDYTKSAFKEPSFDNLESFKEESIVKRQQQNPEHSPWKSDLKLSSAHTLSTELNDSLNTGLSNSKKKKAKKENTERTTQTPVESAVRNAKKKKRKRNKDKHEKFMSEKVDDGIDNFTKNSVNLNEDVEVSGHSKQNLIPYIASSNTPKEISRSSQLAEKARKCLQAAKFRILNEKLYTVTGNEALQYFQTDADAFQDYHQGYHLQVKKWPINPVNLIISDLSHKSASLVIADMGCGDAKIAQVFPKRTIHSFDLVALNEYVTCCNISKVPLGDNCVDIAVFCLSLMGKNLSDYIWEAYRILKYGGLLKIAEVESRIEDLSKFTKSIEKYGFILVNKDISHKMFVLLDFNKMKRKLKKTDLPTIDLSPCLYKKR